MHIIFNNTTIDKKLYFKKEFKKNDIVFFDGELCDSIGFLESGDITITTATFSENEYEITHVTPNGFFGAFLLFSNNPHYLGTAIATKNSVVVFFKKDNLLIAMKDKNFLNNYLTLTSLTTLNIQRKIKILSQKSIRDKIMFLLYENYKTTNKKSLRISGKQQLANYLNIPRPSLSRELMLLKKDGLIDYNRNYITLINNI